MGGAQPRNGALDLGALAFEMPDLTDDLIGVQPFLELRMGGAVP